VAKGTGTFVRKRSELCRGRCRAKASELGKIQKRDTPSERCESEGTSAGETILLTAAQPWGKVWTTAKGAFSKKHGQDLSPEKNLEDFTSSKL